MIVVRFKVQIKPETAEQALALFEAVIAPSRVLEGVISFDGGRDLADPNAIIFIEVFEDRAALDRQESLPEVEKVVGVFEEILAAEPEATIYNVSSAEPYGE
jgi:quinol monooxygenase YgiN